MSKYVAFLRGINVGGKNLIKMEDLRREFENMGFRSVKTYIQSGNVIFESDISDCRSLEEIIELGLSTAFNYKSKVMLRSRDDMTVAVEDFPEIFNDYLWKHNVIYLSSLIDSEDILREFALKEDIEQIKYRKGVLYWSAKLDKIGKSTMIKLSAKKEYQEMTVRNINTTRKILELLNADN